MLPDIVEGNGNLWKMVDVKEVGGLFMVLTEV